MKELLAVVGLAKVRADAGFSRVGRRLRAEDPADRALMLLAARAVSASNAAMALCERGHANEALPLLRAVAEWSLAVRWVAASDSAARAAEELARLDAPSWEGLWPEAGLRERAAAFQVPAKAVDAALGSAAAFSRGNAQGLPWGHAAAAAALPGLKAEEVLSACAAFLGEMLAGLDARWPGEFPGAEELRQGSRI